MDVRGKKTLARSSLRIPTERQALAVSQLVEDFKTGDSKSRWDAFLGLMAVIDIENPAAAMASLGSHVVALVGSKELGRWIDHAISRLENADLDWAVLNGYADDRSILEVLLDCDPSAVATSRFSLDWWDEKLLVPPMELSVREPRPAVPKSHWWWFPEPDDPEILDSMEPFGAIDLGAEAIPLSGIMSKGPLTGATEATIAADVGVDALRARADELTFRSRAAATGIARHVHEVAPDDRSGYERGAALMRELGRRAVREGAVVGRSRAGAYRFYFHHRRVIAEACIDSSGYAYLRDVIPRARIPADLAADPAAVVAAFERANRATDYRERRLCIAAAMDGLAPIARAVSAGALDADVVRHTLAPAIVDRDMFLGWRRCVERRLDADQWPIEQLREDRTALGFLLELGDRVGEGMFDELVDLPDFMDWRFENAADKKPLVGGVSG